MEHKITLPTLMFFENGNGYKGSSGLLRFHIYPAEEREEGRAMAVAVWCGPFCEELAQRDDSREFPLNQAGLDALTAWLEDWSVRMEAQPTHSLEEAMAYRDQARKK
jgi:hypothetical protein